MTAYPSVNDFFVLLDKWRHFPAFSLEPRSEVLFALFLPTVLKESKCVGVEVKPQIIPQFPLKKENNNQSVKVDFFALSKDGERAFLIELKTDMASIRKKQSCYLKEAQKRGISSIMDDFKEISKSKRPKYARQKYFYLAHALSELGLIGPLSSALEKKMWADDSRGVYNLIDDIRILVPPACKLEVVYVQPQKSEEDKLYDDRFHYIYFDEFAEIVESQGDMGGLFAGYLRKWKDDPAKQPPRKTASD